MKLKGTAWKFAQEDISTDLIRGKAYSHLPPKEQGAHCLEEVDAAFASKAQPGDFIVAGRNFAFGKAHSQGLIAIATLKQRLLCESMPFNSYRGAISRGIVCHRRCTGITDLVNDGDTIEMDFATGVFTNVTTGATAQFDPVQRDLLDMMLVGGMRPMLAKWRDEHIRAA